MTLLCPAGHNHMCLQGTAQHPPQTPLGKRRRRNELDGGCWSRESVVESDREAWHLCWRKTLRDEHHVPMAVHTHTSQVRGLWTLGARKKSHQVLCSHKEKEEPGQHNQSCAVRHHRAALRRWKGRWQWHLLTSWEGERSCKGEPDRENDSLV